MSGAVLALFLKKHKISCAIYELRPKAYTHGGNIALAPNALRVLDHAGVYDELRVSGFNYEELSFMNGSGEVLGKFLNGSQKHYNYSAIRIHRTTVRDILRKEVEAQGIPIYYEKKCAGISNETGKNAVIEFTDGEQVEAEFVVGCDGIHSHIRPFIEPNTDPSFSGLMGIMGTVMSDKLESISDTKKTLHLPCMLYGANGSFAIMPSSYDGHEIGYFATLQAEDRSREAWSELGTNISELRKMLEDRFIPPQYYWPPLVKELCQKVPDDSITVWPFFSVPRLSSWTSHNKRIVVIGDAAHAIPLTGGQGAAMAFEDAETLAYVLSRMFALDFNQASLPDIFAKWEAHRIARIEKVLDFTTKNGNLRKSSPHFYEQAAKEWVVWAAFKWMGPEGNAQWLYEYNAEDVLSALV